MFAMTMDTIIRGKKKKLMVLLQDSHDEKH